MVNLFNVEVRYQEGDGSEYHLYIDGEYSYQLNRDEIITALQEYYNEKENR